MKIKDSVNLEKYGFYLMQVEDEYRSDYYLNGLMVYNIGHARRGQYYYYFIDKDRRLNIIATEPDGCGGSISMDDVLLEMFKDGCFE